MTAASFPSKMMSTSIEGEFCGMAYEFGKEICWNPAVYGEWWKHVLCMCQNLYITSWEKLWTVRPVKAWHIALTF